MKEYDEIVKHDMPMKTVHLYNGETIRVKAGTKVDAIRVAKRMTGLNVVYVED